MSISNVESGHAHLSNERRSQLRQHQVGEQMRLTVLQRLDETRYQVGFADGWRIVNSTVALPVGGVIHATVTAVGERLELQYLGSDVVAAAMAEHEATSEDALVAHEQRFRIALSDSDRATLRKAVESADDTESMLNSALFLGKLSVPLDPAKLQAVYESQRWSAAVQARADAPVMPASRTVDDVDQLATSIESALREAPQNISNAVRNASTTDTPDAGDEDEAERRRQLAWELLNDQDGGSVEYRYGVLPLLIADQLFELDLVYFRDRQSSAEPAAKSKRMVMTLNAPSLGRVEVLAQSVGDRVAVTIKSDSEASKQLLSAERERVEELLDRLGWAVDAVRYEVNDIDTRAAARVVEHVLNGDSLSRWA